MAAATEAGMLPRCTGMCSAWTSSSPAAVNTAAEQSARSLMFGERADRRSTSPISVGHAGQLRDQDLQGRGFHRQPALVSTQEPDGSATAVRHRQRTQTVQSASRDHCRARVGTAPLADGQRSRPSTG